MKVLCQTLNADCLLVSWQIEELPSAIMLEQAAIGLLRLPHPAKRRFALLMAIAAQRYQKTGSVSSGTLAVHIGTHAQDRKLWLGDAAFKHFRSILEAIGEAGNWLKPISTRL